MPLLFSNIGELLRLGITGDFLCFDCPEFMVSDSSPSVCVGGWGVESGVSCLHGIEPGNQCEFAGIVCLLAFFCLHGEVLLLLSLLSPKLEYGSVADATQYSVIF